MKSEKCINCSQKKQCKDSSASWIFFIIGLLSTIAVRIVTVLIHINPVYGKISWYSGVGGFFLFFLYKYNISKSTMRMIQQQHIMDKIDRKERLSKNDYKIISEILCAVSSEKERINYFFIFGLSALALIIAIYIDFIK
jgi:hypothetical protein